MNGMKRLKLLEKQFEFLKLKRFIYIGILLGLLLQLMNLVPTLLLQKLVDDFLPNQDFNLIYLSIGILIILPLFSSSLALFQKVWINDIAKIVGNKLSLSLFEKLMNQPLSYYTDHNSNELLSYCNKSFYGYLLFWMTDFPSAIVNVITGCLLFGWLFSIHWSFSLLMLLYIPILKYPGDKISAQVGIHIQQIVKVNAKVSEVIGETFKGIKTVKLFQLQQARLQALKVNYKKVEGIWREVVFFDNLSGIWINQFASSLFVALTLGLAIYFLLQDQLTLGQLIVIFSISRQYYQVVHAVMYNQINLAKQDAEHEQLFTYLNLEDVLDEGFEQHMDSNFKLTHLDFEEVSFSHQGHSIIQNLTLTIPIGSWIGIIGVSGIGKSTLLDLLNGSNIPGAGQILINESSISTLHKQTWLKHVMTISPDHYVFSGSVRANFELMKPSITETEIVKSLELVGLSYLIPQLADGLETPLGENGNVLSQGERQRLILALGLLKEAQLYILDEVTSHLDIETENKVKALFKQKQIENGVTIVSVSHNHNFLTDCDCVYEMQQGGIFHPVTNPSIS